MHAGQRVEAGAVFTVELAVAADLVEQGRAVAVEKDGAAAVTSHRKATHEALVRKIESENTERTAARVAARRIKEQFPRAGQQVRASPSARCPPGQV